jgi:hypothetical protein
MAVRAPQLHHALRGFVLGAFAFLLRELDDAGESLPFAFEEHAGADGPALYEYRPLVRDFVEARAGRLRGREDATIALDELVREPAAAIYARAHAGPDQTAVDALFRTVLVDLLIRVAEACGGFDWDDTSFDRKAPMSRWFRGRWRIPPRWRRKSRRWDAGPGPMRSMSAIPRP